MRIVFILLLLSSSQLCCVRAQDSAEVEAVKNLIDAQQKMLSGITSLSYTATLSSKCTADFMAGAGIYGETKMTFTYLCKGNKWKYDVEEFNKTGMFLSQEFAYDGKQSQSLNKQDGVLLLTSSKLLSNSYLANDQYIFFPFKFIPEERLKNPFFPLTLSEFSSSANWNSLADRIQNVHLDLVNKVLSFELPGETSYDGKGKYSYKVVCSQTLSGFPVKWQKIYAAKALSEEYSVTNISKLAILPAGVTFYYPSSAQIKAYDGGKLSSVADVNVSSVQINNDIDDDQFVIDPASAKVIKDVDHHTTIEVPR